MADVLMTSDPVSGNASLDQKAILIVAVEELDRIISELIREAKITIAPDFLDWVADPLTVKIEARLMAALQSVHFEDILRSGNLRTVLAHWVKYWTCFEIQKHFGHYAKFCPCAKAPLPWDGR